MARRPFNRRPRVLLLGVVVGIGVSGPATPSAGGSWPPSPSGVGAVERVFVRPDREITVSWTARSRAPGSRFRLYQAVRGAGRQLVGEIPVLAGQHTYRIENLPEVFGSAVFLLSFTGESWDEIIVGTLICIEHCFESRSTSPRPAPDLTAIVPAQQGPCSPDRDSLRTNRARSARCARPEPERPPPRSSSV